MRRAARTILAGAALVGAAGCSAPEPQSCPRTTILGIASDLTRYRPGGGEDLTDLAFQMEILGMTIECRTTKGRVDTTLSVALSAERGPAGRGNPEVSYFVAIVERATQKILDKQVYGGRIPIPEGQRRGVAIEEWDQLIPLPKGKAGKDYEIMVGFNLTPEELDAARRRREQ